MKIKNKLLGFLPILLGGAALGTVVATVSTSCSTHHYKFKDEQSVISYLQKHIVNASEDHNFTTQDFSGHYAFVKSNFNFDLLINGVLYDFLLNDNDQLEFPAGAEIDLDASSSTATFTLKKDGQSAEYKFKYKDSVASFYINNESKWFDFDFKKGQDQNHEITASHKDAAGKDIRILNFEDQAAPTIVKSVDLSLSQFDWENWEITWPLGV